MVPEIPPLQAQQLLASDSPPALIDVREQEEWEFCRLPGAELVPLSRFGELQESRFTRPDEPLLFVCHHGVRSARAVEHLAARGFTAVMNLSGGIDAWSLQVDPAVPRY